MMPSAQQQLSIKQTMKPKSLKFSIESIVGKDEDDDYCENSGEAKLSKISADALSSEYLELIKRARNLSNNNNNELNSADKNSDSNNVTKSRSPEHQQQAPLVVPGIQAGFIRPMVSNNMGPHYTDGPGHPHLLAQFQAAAALANVQAIQSGFPAQHMPPHFHNPNISRESYPLYPWLLSRHGRIFPHRFPGSEY
jgi:hypothetical protein